MYAWSTIFSKETGSLVKMSIQVVKRVGSTEVSKVCL